MRISCLNQYAAISLLAGCDVWQSQAAHVQVRRAARRQQITLPDLCIKRLPISELLNFASDEVAVQFKSDDAEVQNARDVRSLRPLALAGT